jgi:predicted nucleic acid-binding protein
MDIMAESILNEIAVITSQVIQEFMNVSLKKLAKPLITSELLAVITEMLAPLCGPILTIDLYQYFRCVR